MNPQTWYEITTCINGEVVLIDTKQSLEYIENLQESLSKKGIKTKIFKWRIEGDKKELVGELS